MNPGVTSHISSSVPPMLMQDGARAELEGVTYTGHTDLGSAPNAPATSLILVHEAVCVWSSQLWAKGAIQVSRQSPVTMARRSGLRHVLP
jgi:hypothetical protein